VRRVLWLVALVALAFGLYGLLDRLAHGHLGAAYGSYIPWGLWGAAYIYFIGLSDGAFLLSSLVYAFGYKQLEPVGRLSLFTALICLFMALLAIWFDLGHMGRFYRVFASPNFRSMMTWMVWLYTAYGLLLLAETYLALWGGEKAKGTLKTLAIIGIPLAFAFHGGVGSLFAVTGAKPFWNSGLLPVMFVVSALASGGAFLTLMVALLWPEKGEAYRQLLATLGRLVMVLLAFDLVLEFSEYFVAFKAALPDHRLSLDTLLAGHHSLTFWLGAIVVAFILPLILLAGRHASPGRIALASLLIVVGFIAVRYLIVVPGQEVPAFPQLVTAYVEPRLTYAYQPSLGEWSLVAFVYGLGLVVYLAGLAKLPFLAAQAGEARPVVGQAPAAKS